MIKLTSDFTQKQMHTAIRFMLYLAQEAVDRHEYTKAQALYRYCIEMCDDATAHFNLACLYYRGKLTTKGFLKAGDHFYKAYLAEERSAGEWCAKSEQAFVEQEMEQITPRMLFLKMMSFVHFVYRSPNVAEETALRLLHFAQEYRNADNEAAAIKCLRAAAEFGDNAFAQHALAQYFEYKSKETQTEEGVGAETLAAIYWYDRASDNGLSGDDRHREKLLKNYANSYLDRELSDIAYMLAGACQRGGAFIPRDEQKQHYWEKLAQGQ